MKEKEEKAERKAKGRGRRGEREKKEKGEEQKGKRGGQFFSGFLPPYHRSEVPDGRETRARDEWESIWG